MYFNVGCLSLDRWCVSSQARKLGEKKTVEALARQFQDQIERIMMEKGVQKSAHIPGRNEREVMEFKKLNREKSFDEARTAVQSQIEKIFQKVRSEAIDTNNPVNTSRVTCHQSAHRAPAQLEYSFGPLSSPNV